MKPYARRCWLICLALTLGAMRLWSQIDVEHVISIGRNALYFNDYVVSIGYFNQAIDARPFLAMPYYYRAVGKISLEDYNGAITDASACIERNPFISKAYLVRGIALQNTGQSERALDDYRLGLNLDPNNMGMRINQAIIYTQLKRFDEAEYSLDTLIRYNPSSIDAYSLRMTIALERGDTTLALLRSEEVLRRDSLMASPYRLKAYIASNRGDYHNALSWLSKAIDIEPNDASLLTNRGIVYYRINKLREAMADYTQALRIEPRNKVARYNRALLRTLVGELSPALEDWGIVLTSEPQNHIARYNRAVLFERLGKLSSALDDLDIVLKQYLSFSEGFLLRSRIHRALGNIKKAEKDYWHAWDLQQNKQYRAVAHATSLQQKQRATRQLEDVSIDKYNMLVEEQQKTSVYKAKYSSATRGRVQDRDVQIEPKSAFYLTYFSQVNEDGKSHTNTLHTYEELDLINLKHKEVASLKLYSKEHTLDASELDSLHKIMQVDSHADSDIYLIKRGIIYNLLQDYDQAIIQLSKAIQLNPSLAIAYFARAYATGRKQEAEQHRELSDSSPTTHSSDDSQNRMPLSSIALSTTPTALNDLNAAVRLAPSFPHAYYNRALLLHSLGEKEKAIEDYNHAIRLAPRMGEAFFNRGLILLSLGKQTEGLSDLSHAGELGIYQSYNIIKRINQP